MVVRAGALLPPPIAQYSKLPAQQWFSDVLPRLVGDGGARAPVVQCLQRAGEAIYVPAVSHRFSKRSTRTANSNSRFEQHFRTAYLSALLYQSTHRCFPSIRAAVMNIYH